MLSLSACTGYEGEAITAVRGDGISAITGAGLRSYPASSGGGSGGSSSVDTPRLSGTYYAEDGSGSITFNGSRITIGVDEWEEMLAMMALLGGRVELTYVLSGSAMDITITATALGETYSETQRVSFMWDGSNAFYFDGVRFTR
jgi:hypothetical protein